MEKAKPDGMYPGFSPVVVSLALCWITWISLLSPGIIFFQHPVALPRRWNPLDALSRVEDGFASSVVTP